MATRIVLGCWGEVGWQRACTAWLLSRRSGNWFEWLTIATVRVHETLGNVIPGPGTRWRIPSVYLWKVFTIGAYTVGISCLVRFVWQSVRSHRLAWLLRVTRTTLAFTAVLSHSSHDNGLVRAMTLTGIAIDRSHILSRRSSVKLTLILEKMSARGDDSLSLSLSLSFSHGASVGVNYFKSLSTDPLCDLSHELTLDTA